MQGMYFKPSWSIINVIIQIKQMLVAKRQAYYRGVAGEGFRFVLHSNCDIMMFIKVNKVAITTPSCFTGPDVKVHVP